MTLPVLRLKAHRDEAARRGHPWIFSGALRPPLPPLAPGDLVDLHDAADAFVGRGYYHPGTDIAARILTRDPAEAIDEAFFARRALAALARREPLTRAADLDAYRLINAEGDDLPGVIVDRYADVLVAQISTAGMERLTDALVAGVLAATQPAAVVLRNDVAVRAREGLERERGRVVAGATGDVVAIQEYGLRFGVDVINGQKTGFFLDQRDKRRALRAYAAGKTVLNTFSFTGAFGVAALAAGARHVTSVDQSGPVIAQAREQFARNGFAADAHEFVVGDAFAHLERAVAEGRRYDIVILDPPAFAKSAQARPQALRAYRRLNALGWRALAPEGLLVTCSCSGMVSLDDFRGVVTEAAALAGVTARTAETFTHGLDHPILMAMPEGGYLKVLFCRN